MEHRWGHRYPLDLPVDIGQGRHFRRGRLRDVSITGLRLSTDTALPLLAQLRLRVALDGYHLQPEGWVVRASPEGYGLEWMEADSLDVHVLLEYAARLNSHGQGLLSGRRRQAGNLRIA